MVVVGCRSVVVVDATHTDRHYWLGFCFFESKKRIITKTRMPVAGFFIFLVATIMYFGISHQQTCGPRISARLLRESHSKNSHPHLVPCDLTTVSYCLKPGNAYPWSSVRRYIFENQGFITKMYGEQRQSQIVQEELQRINDRYGNFRRQAKKIQDTATTNNETIIDTTEDYFQTTIEDDNDDSMITTTMASAAISEDDNDDSENETISNEQIKGYQACPITQEVVAPYWANNTRGETLALLNVYPFEQYIHWERCQFEGKKMFCRNGCRCEQQFRLHRLLAFDPRNECRGIFSDWFRFPGSCSCICYDHQEEDEEKPSLERINNRKARL